MSSAYLANVQVAALGVNLRIASHESSGVKAICVRDNITVIVGLNDVSSGAVLASQAKAQVFTRGEVGTLRVDLGVHNGQLVAT